MNVFELFKESFGVGVVASKKQAKDPRYSHSLTVDVKPDTPKKNQRALGLTESPRADGSFENRDEYYKEMYPMALKAVSKLGLQIPPELLVTQWGFESGWGSKVTGDNNFFGIKANKGYKGDSKEVATHEYEDGKKVKIKDKFRSYDSLDDAVDDYVNFIKNNPRYTEAGVFDAKNSEEYMAALQKAGYATDPEYADKILKQEKITTKQIAKVVPPEEQEKLKAELPTVAATPQEEEPKQSVDAIATLQTAFQKAMKDGDGKAMNDILQNVKALGGDKAMQSVAKNEYKAGDISPERQNREAVTATQSALDKDGQTPGDRAQADAIEKEKAKDDAINAELGGSDAAGVTPTTDAGTDTSEYDDVADAFGSEEDAALQDKQQEELGKTYAERAKDDLDDDRLSKEEAELKRLQTELEYAGTEDAFGGERQSKEEVDAQKKELEREIDVKKRAIAFIKDPGMTSDGGGSMTPEQLEFLKAKEKEDLEIKKAKEEGREPDPALIGNKSVGELELDAARAYRYAAQAEKEGKPEVAAAARKEADANMKVRQDMIDLGVTWMSGAGNPDQAQRTIDDVKAGNTTGINMFQKPEGKEREQFQQNQAEADRQDKEKGEGAWDRTSTLDDEKKKVDPTPIDKRPQVEPEKPKSTTAAKTSYSGAVASAGGTTSKGGGYGQGAEVDATVSATPKEDPYPNPGYEGEELRIYNKLSDSQKAKIISDFEKTKQNQANLNKNANVRSGPPPRDPESLKPRSLLDIVHQKQLSGIEGGTQLVDPAKAKEISKVLGMSVRSSEDKKKRDAELEKLRYKAPSMAELQKGMEPEKADPKVATTPKQEVTKANVPAADTSDSQSAIGQAIQPGTNLGKDNASQQAQDLQKQKAEAEKQKAEQQAAAAKQKAEQEAQAQKQEQERQRQEAEQKRKEQEAARAKGVGTTSKMNTQTFQPKKQASVGLANQFDVRKKVPESAIFRAIMRK